MDILALTMADFLGEWVWPIALLILGLGAVILVHEFGHFVVAKAVGIKVERFAMGFGPRLFGFKRGETDYCVNLLPLGGYVKMLGQEDFAPLKDGQADPRAFNNKSVRARFAVISAGVIMNLIFAAILFIIVCMAGIQFLAPVVGGVSEGLPADEVAITWQEGPAHSDLAKPKLQAGDEILEVDGKELSRWEHLLITAALADPDDKFRMKIRRRTGDGDLIGHTLIGVREAESPSGGKILAFGIGRPADAVLGKIDGAAGSDPYEEGDRIVRIRGRGFADREIRYYWDIEQAAEKLDGSVVTITVDRIAEDHKRRRIDIPVQPTTMTRGKVFFRKDGTRFRVDRILELTKKKIVVRIGEKKKDLDPNNLVMDARILDVLGCRARMRITSVLDGSPAEEAGVKPNDVILAYGDRDTPNLQRFLDTSKEVIGSSTQMVVQRGGKRLAPLTVTPKKRNGEFLVGISQTVDMTAAVVATVRPGSPAQKAGLVPGDEIVNISTVNSVHTAPATTRATTATAATAPSTRPTATLKYGHPVANWADVIQCLKDLRGKEVVISYRRGGHVRHAVIGKLTDEIFEAGDYRMVLFTSPRPFRPLLGPEIKKNPLAAIPWGVSETWLFVLRTYATLRALMNRTVSHEQVVGPVGMGDIAIQAGRESIVKLIYFMAIISVSLAVINFLPIPVVDGGHAVFLLIEALRRKPVPVKVMNIVQVIGMVLLLFVFVAVTWQDIRRIVQNLW